MQIPVGFILNISDIKVKAFNRCLHLTTKFVISHLFVGTFDQALSLYLIH